MRYLFCIINSEMACHMFEMYQNAVIRDFEQVLQFEVIYVTYVGQHVLCVRAYFNSVLKQLRPFGIYLQQFIGQPYLIHVYYQW